MVAVNQWVDPMVRRGIKWLSENRLPQTDGQLRLAGLQAEVTVFRDAWGVPHIYAANEPDLLFAQGFIHAQDRLWQMEFQRRMVAGRLSEVVGAAGLPVDRWMRVLGIYRVVEQEAAQACPEEHDLLAAYCAGVNAFLAVGRLPVEFTLLRYRPEPWRPADSLAWVKILNWYLSSNWECELLRGQLIDKLGPAMAAELELDAAETWPLVLDIPDLLGLEKHLSHFGRTLAGSGAMPGAGSGAGSNNWAVSGAKSSSGKPLFANDMHLAMMMPALWYENHLEGGGFRVTGVSLPGSPLVVAGHNDKVAWGYTAGFADNQDLFREHLRISDDDAGSMQYEFRGEWLPAEVRQEEIHARVAGSVTQEVIVTHHGPIINTLVAEETSEPLALQWAPLQPDPQTLCVLAAMNRAPSAAAFHQATAGWAGPVLNAVYADVDGNIGYSLMGQIPIRAAGDGRTPAAGWTGAAEWTGMIPFEQLPHLFNPPQGYIVTANNRVAAPNYPHLLGSDYVTGDRAERITQLLLTNPTPLDLSSFQRMQFDQISPSAQTLIHFVRHTPVDDPDVQPLVALLTAWDGAILVDSPAALVYEVLTRQLFAVLLESRLGAHLLARYTGKGPNALFMETLWGHHSQEWLRKWMSGGSAAWFDLDSGETVPDALTQALRRTLAYLENRFGADSSQWQWGSLHRLTFQHILGMQKPLDAAFNRGPYPVGGDGNTIWSNYSPLHDPATDVVTGPPFRFLADLADLDHCLGLLAPGQSGHVGSPHYDDQIDAWFHAGYHPMLFNPAEVEQNQRHCLRLLPEQAEKE